MLKVDRHSALLYQEAYLTDELNDMFADADAQGHDASFLAEQQIREAYRGEIGNLPEASKPKKNEVQQKTVTDDDDCPICCESLIVDKSNILFCSISCGNNMHKHCFNKWQQAKVTMNERVTCPFCRVVWKSTVEQPPSSSHGYLNLAAYSMNDDYSHPDEGDDDDDEDDHYYHYRRRFNYFRY